MGTRIPGLDGLRGLAASIVLLSHLSNWGYHLIPSVDLGGTGKSGVYLFFVLSAFLLTSQMLERRPSQLLTLAWWRGYLQARTLRIWPLYVVIITVCVATTHLHQIPYLWRLSDLLGGIPVAISADRLLSHLLLQDGEEDLLWTIPVEFKFYFLLPPVVLLCMSLATRQRAGPIGLLVVAIAFAHLYLPAVSSGISPIPFLGVFLTGVLVAFLLNYGKGGAASSASRALSEGIAWLTIGLYVLTVPSVYSLFSGSREALDLFHTSHFLFSALWGVLIATMLLGTGWMRNVLETRTLRFLGRISFSLYLWHMAVVQVVHELPSIPGPMKGVVILAGSLLVSAASYAFIERPVLRWRSERKGRARAAAALREAPLADTRSA